MSVVVRPLTGPGIVFGSSKHLALAKLGSRWYKLGGDHVQLDPESPSFQSGRQEVISWNALASDFVMDQGFYLPAGEKQPALPDDSFAVTVENESWLFISTRTGAVQQVAGKAEQVAGYVMARNPSGKWRIVCPNPKEVRGNGAWHAVYDRDRRRVVVPCGVNGLVLVVIDTATGADVTQRVGGVPVLYWSGTNAHAAGFAVDWAARVGYLWAHIDAKLLRVNLDSFKVDVLASIPEPSHSDQAAIGLVLYEPLRVPVLFGERMHVWLGDRFESFDRPDGQLITKRVPTSRQVYDDEARAIMSIGTIDWSGGERSTHYWLIQLSSTSTATATTVARSTTDGTLPSWVPAPGEVRAIPTNSKLRDVDPGPGVWSGGVGATSHNMQRGLLDAWNSGGVAEDYGSLGALVVCGAGDGDSFDNSVYVQAFDSLRWERLAGPSSAMNGQPANDPQFDPVRGEHGDGTPAMPHTYDQVEIVPRELGGGPSGSLILPTRFIAYMVGKHRWSHRCDLGARVWRRASANQSNMSNCDSPSWCLDRKRGRLWGIPSGPSPVGVEAMYWLDLSTQLHGRTPIKTHFSLGGGMTSRWWSSRDLIVVVGKNAGRFAVRVYDPSDLAAGPVDVGLTGDQVPAWDGYGFAHFARLDCFFVRVAGPGYEQNLWRLDAPAGDPRGAPWGVRQIRMGGDSVKGVTLNGIWKRFSAAQKLDCLVWVSSVDGPTYAYRPPPS